MAARRRDQGTAPSGAASRAGEVMALPLTDWLLHRLTVSGPAAAVARFREAARGTNAIPWHLDLDEEEARLLAPMATLGPEARALARELREVIAARHDAVLARWAEPGACPLDLHRLIPVPPAILRLGERAPEAQAWLWTQWGTTQPLGKVQVIEDRPDRRLRRAARVVYGFTSADWTPWRAIRALRRDWPALIFDVRPCYGETAGPSDG
jgi:hypothetical protein